MRFLILGPLQVFDSEGQPIAVRGRVDRVILAALLLEPGRVVSRDRLIEAVWGDDPPETAPNAIQVHISKLRKLLGDAGGSGERAPHQGTGLCPGALARRAGLHGVRTARRRARPHAKPRLPSPPD